MELEFHQLDVRYERLRVRQPARERRLLASLADAGQQMPIVVVTAHSTYVVVDGHKRVRCLRQLRRDTVAAVVWEMPEAEALIFRQLLRTDAADSAFEQGWLLRTLHEDHGLALDALARRFDRSVSWVSRRVSLVRTLPDAVQQHVQDGRLVPHAAMKYLVPVARANAADCLRLVEAIAPHRLTTRQIGRLYQVYVTGPEASRELVLTDPLLVLRVTDDTPRAPVRPDASGPEALMSDLHIVGAVARRAARRLQYGGGLLPPERARAWRLFDQVQTDFHDLQRRCEKELAMLDQGLRTAILSLRAKGHGIRQIARALQISRGAVRTVLNAGSPTVPRIERAEKAEPYRDQILEWVDRCRGNLVRVHEELVAQGVAISYPALTAFCRRHAIGHEPPAPVGHYDFQPAQEMQHDTSPHRAPIGGIEQRIETASLVLCYSRMLFFQAYPVFTRFYCKVFLTDALEYLAGAAATCMIDNTHVVVAAGTGARMVPAPEMAAFAERFNFTFRAHEKGDVNRSARVERPFHFIEHNFLAGRTFADLAGLNTQARAFCDKVNATPKRHLHASPRELFAAERPHLRPLPLFVPEVYALHHRLVDVEGFVNVHGHRYSAPYLLIGRQLEVRETKDRIDVYHGPRLVASHAKVLGRTFTRVSVPEHRPPRGARPSTQPLPEEQTLAQADPPVPTYAVSLKQRSAGRGTLALRRLLALYREYPRAPFLQAVRLAAQYGLFDLDRLERLILRVIAKDYFRLSPGDEEPES